MDFRTWAERRKIKDSDLIFTRALKTPEQNDLFKQVSDLMAQFDPSFSDGLIFLEQVTDLLLQGQGQKLLPPAEDFPRWKSGVQSLRYPQTTLRDAETKANLESLPWPVGAKVKFERRGDRAGVELKIFISGETDLIKAISALERVQREFTK